MAFLKLLIDCKKENEKLTNTLSALDKTYSYLSSLEDKY